MVRRPTVAGARLEHWRELLRDRVARGGPPEGGGKETGSAMVEFVFLSILLLVPLVYLVVTLARIQAGAFAAESAAHDAARASVVTGVESREQGASNEVAMEHGAERARAAVSVALENFGFKADDSELTFACDARCLEQGSNVTADVTVTVALPGIPGFVSSAIPLGVEVSASARAPVDSVRSDS